MDWILAGKLIFAAALSITCVVTIRYGESSERIALAVIVLGSAATGLLAASVPLLGPGARHGYVAIDVAVLAAFDQIMVRTHRAWPIWITAMQLAAICLGVAMLIEPAQFGQYRLIQGKWAYGMMVAITLGSLKRRAT